MLTFKNQAVTLNGPVLKKGDIFPAFTVTDQNMQDVNSTQIIGKKIYLSVPSIDTDVCSMELSKFITYLKDRLDVTCLAISMDLPFAQQRWCQNQQSENVTLYSDFKYHSFAKASSTFINELHLLARSAFIVDENNTIQYVEYVSEVSHEPDYSALLQAL